MIEVVVNELQGDGMRRVRVVSDFALSTVAGGGLDTRKEQERATRPTVLGRGMRRLVPNVARELVQVSTSVDEALGIHSLEVVYPVYGVWDVQIFSPKKFRRLFFVNFVYGARVSECIELARVAFFAGTRFAPVYAFIRCLPSGAEDGMDVHGLVLLEAEWMPERCVAVGG